MPTHKKQTGRSQSGPFSIRPAGDELDGFAHLIHFKQGDVVDGGLYFGFELLKDF